MSKGRILIVEDEALVAKDLESRLTATGYNVCGKSNTGLKAIALSEKESPDLILMDIVLKGDMDGIETAEHIRSTLGTPVVFLTAYADQEKLDRAKLSLPFGYILKPFQDRELNITIEMALYASKVDEKRRKAEEELRISQQQLIQSQKMEALGTLVAGVAHEINNPINLISFNINMLQSVWHDLQPVLEVDAGQQPDKTYGGLPYSYLEKNLDQLVTDMDAAAKSITQIVVNLKNFAKGTYDLQKKSVLINNAVENALRLAATTIRKQHIKIDMNFCPDLPMIEADQQAIEQVILNLIINASQAIDHDSGHIKLETKYDESQGRINISVEDNGSGIDTAIKDNIFNPFFTTKQSHGGTGLGLSVSYSLIKSHDGDIAYKSRPGQGSTFTISLPTPEKARGKKILIVDDDPYIRDVLDRALSRSKKYLIDIAKNGEEACVKLGMNKPDLIILDLFMPLMDGVEVCRMIKNEPNLRKTKVIVITGNTSDSKVQEMSDFGFKTILSKPLDVAVFIDRVNECLGQ